jgi:trans-aconitate methyltransferase
MTKNPQKDFGPIAADYSFFESHATEAEQDARAYLQRLQDTVPKTGVVRMLDFGCGSGSFTERLLAQAGWLPERLQLTLVEPVESARWQAASRLVGYTDSCVAEFASLPAGREGSFDIILANHVFYYVPDLEHQLARLIAALAVMGTFVTAIAARNNALIAFWIAAFRLLGQDIPYHTSESVETTLQQLGQDYHKQQVAYELTFPDSEENRMRIIRFLLADHLSHLPHRPLLGFFDQYRDSDQIRICAASDHFTICSERPLPVGHATG